MGWPGIKKLGGNQMDWSGSKSKELPVGAEVMVVVKAIKLVVEVCGSCGA